MQAKALNSLIPMAIDNRLFEAVPVIWQSCHFGITGRALTAHATTHAIAAWPAVAHKDASPEATPPPPYRGGNSHIGPAGRNIGRILTRNALAANQRVGGWV